MPQRVRNVPSRKDKSILTVEEPVERKKEAQTPVPTREEVSTAFSIDKPLEQVERRVMVAGDSMGSENFVASGGTEGWGFDGEGNLTANNGTFRGTLDGTDGTFEGTLDGADGTFTGEVRVGDDPDTPLVVGATHGISIPIQVEEFVGDNGELRFYKGDVDTPLIYAILSYSQNSENSLALSMLDPHPSGTMNNLTLSTVNPGTIWLMTQKVIATGDLDVTGEITGGKIPKVTAWSRTAVQRTGQTTQVVLTTTADSYSYVPGRLYEATVVLYAASCTAGNTRWNIQVQTSGSDRMGEYVIAEFTTNPRTYSWTIPFKVSSVTTAPLRIHFGRRDGTGAANLYTGGGSEWVASLVVKDVGPA